MAIKMTLIKVSDPKTGVTREEYEAVCAALGIEPKPPGPTASATK
jgi:hypothetical protein